MLKLLAKQYCKDYNVCVIILGLSSREQTNSFSNYSSATQKISSLLLSHLFLSSFHLCSYLRFREWLLECFA